MTTVLYGLSMGLFGLRSFLLFLLYGVWSMCCVCVCVLLGLAGNSLDDSRLCGVQVGGCTTGLEERTLDQFMHRVYVMHVTEYYNA